MYDANRPTQLPRWSSDQAASGVADDMLYRAPVRMAPPSSQGIYERPPSVVVGGRSFGVADSLPQAGVAPRRHLARGDRGVRIDVHRSVAPGAVTMQRPIDALEDAERHRRRYRGVPGAPTSAPVAFHDLGRLHADYDTRATAVEREVVQAEHNFAGGRIAQSTTPHAAQAFIPRQSSRIVSDRDQAPGDPILPRGRRTTPYGSSLK